MYAGKGVEVGGGQLGQTPFLVEGLAEERMKCVEAGGSGGKEHGKRREQHTQAQALSKQRPKK